MPVWEKKIPSMLGNNVHHFSFCGERSAWKKNTARLVLCLVNNSWCKIQMKLNENLGFKYHQNVQANTILPFVLASESKVGIHFNRLLYQTVGSCDSTRLPWSVHRVLSPGRQQYTISPYLFPLLVWINLRKTLLLCILLRCVYLKFQET